MPVPPTTPTSPLSNRLPTPAALPSASAGLPPAFQPPSLEPGFSGSAASGGGGSTTDSDTWISCLVLPTGCCGWGVSIIFGLEISFGAVILAGLGDRKSVV